MRARYGEKLGTQAYYAKALKQFCEYVGMNPDEIIAAYKRGLKEDMNVAIEEWNEKVELFVPWLVDNYDVGRPTAVTRFNAIKSFFKHNAAIKLTVPTPEFYSEPTKPITIDDLRDKILPFANIFQTFEILFLKDSGISQSDALRLNVGDIEDQGNGFGYVKTVRKKENVDYETFIGPNAMDAMNKCLDYRRRLGHKVTADSPLFVRMYNPAKRQTRSLITGSFGRLGEKAGVSLSTHRLRKTFETFMAIARVHPIVLKYWMGHKVKRGKSDVEARYIIPPKPEQLKMYIDGYKHIDLEEKPETFDILVAETKARMVGMTPEERKRFARQLAFRYKRLAGHPEIKKMLEEQPADGGLPAQPTFKEIGENELLTYLNNGWQISIICKTGRLSSRKGRNLLTFLFNYFLRLD